MVSALTYMQVVYHNCLGRVYMHSSYKEHSSLVCICL